MYLPSIPPSLLLSSLSYFHLCLLILFFLPPSPFLQILTTFHLPLSWLESFPTHAAATTVALFLPAVITYGVHLAFQAPMIG